MWATTGTGETTHGPGVEEAWGGPGTRRHDVNSNAIAKRMKIRTCTSSSICMTRTLLNRSGQAIEFEDIEVRVTELERAAETQKKQ